ncbi:MAG: hypothetical protein JWM36_950 [Hyphomicrobiales bacterium]|nr:hypothetical protein [Hyphomicrobiales bacterium]
MFDPRPMPLIQSVECVGATQVRVHWAKGTRAGKTETVDMAPIVNAFRVYGPLKARPDLLATVHVVERGHAIAWGDEEIDMAATSLERLAEEAMTNEDFAGFLQRMKLTHQGAAAVLGRSKRQIENYLSGTPIPRIVALACRAVEHDLKRSA